MDINSKNIIMKNLYLILSSILISVQILAQGILKSHKTEISFYSSTPLEDITANSQKGMSAINLNTKQIYVKVHNTSFEFKAKLMQEHFNENYIESDKFPYSEFTGKVIDEVDLTKSGIYHVTIEGKLSLHGITKSYKTKAIITNDNGKITSSSNIKVKLNDHNIKVPSLVFEKIAEEIDIKILATYL